VSETTNLAYIIAALFIVVFVINLLPAFAPPTWTTMSFIGLTVPSIDVVLLALVAATAATCGRVAFGEIITGSRAAEIADRTGAAQRRCDQDGDRESESNDGRDILGLFAQPAAVELFVHCVWTNIATNSILVHTFLYWTVCELRVLDEDGLHDW
jgi:hypothetical protein